MDKKPNQNKKNNNTKPPNQPTNKQKKPKPKTANDIQKPHIKVAKPSTENLEIATNGFAWAA